MPFLCNSPETGEAIFGNPSNLTHRKRYVRRRAKKMARNAYQRENVLTDRDCLSHSRRALTETERAAALANTPKKQEKKHAYKPDNYEGNFKLNTGASHGVVTHPEPTFEKDNNYPHGRLTSPSHLWCDVVHASDKDVIKGARTK